ncbi:hypothetical protein F5144DRAFT_527695 [Chaetomium tenue]|uniref:Uncharacterized protein n=1 Tax=Chaetomium tenue TaxID=1854479 RepID=A0ACB7PHC1_9PEZI|nr:hypothetical protein F5144DRAFT_527695 [Chaetomium globosum]
MQALVLEAPQPTAQENHLFYSVIQNTKGRPEIDWDGVAAASESKNAETAKVGRLSFGFSPRDWVVTSIRVNPTTSADRHMKSLGSWEFVAEPGGFNAI